MTSENHKFLDQMPNVATCARALILLNNANIFNEAGFIHVLGTIVRQSTEPCAPSRNHSSAHYRSAMAAQAIAKAQINSRAKYEAWCKSKANKIRHEHMVPTRVRIQLLREGVWTEDHVAYSLSTFGIRASIHYEEDARLTAMGLKSAMPQGFYESGNVLYMEPRARYIAAGLDATLTRLEAENWFDQDRA